MAPTYNIVRERILRILLRRVWLISKVYGRLELNTFHRQVPMMAPVRRPSPSLSGAEEGLARYGR